jgi:flagellar hook-length control protein FliK
LKNGTPLATIVNRIAQSVGSSVANALTGKLSQSDLARIQSSITQTIANALSPPGNGPPGTAAEQAATLAARLQQMVESLARDGNSGVGQQNELSGNLLDAISAKDIPAQHKSNGTSSNALDVSLLVLSLVSSALTSLQTAPSAAGTNLALKGVGGPATTAASAPTLSALLSAPFASLAQTPPRPPDAAATLAPPNPNGSPNVASSSAITMANAPDLLARMLVRAAGVDATINGAAATGQSAPQQPSTPLTPTMLAARFAALLASSETAVGGASSNGNSSTGANTGHSPDTNLSNADSASNLFAPGPSASLTTQVQSAFQSQTPASSAVNVSAVIEQLVQSMTMRTVQQGTSEIRLQLQPENLGEVTMKLTVSGSQVSANLVAQNADVQTVLVANHQDLARSLASAGLTLSGFSVDVSGGDAGSDQNKDRTAGFGRRYVVHEVGGEPVTESADASSSGPALLGSTNLELFNYLA